MTKQKSTKKSTKTSKKRNAPSSKDRPKGNLVKGKSISKMSDDEKVQAYKKALKKNDSVKQR